MQRRIVIQKQTLMVLSVFSVFCFLTFTNLKTFEPWSQVTILWSSGWPLLHFTDHFHFERYLTVYLGLMLEEAYPEIGFSVYISLFVTLNILLFRRIHKAFTGHPPNLFAYVIFLITHLAMNGRGPIGWCGWMLCLDLYGRFNSPKRTGPFMTVRNSCQFFFSILFSSVSTGVFIVVFTSIILLIIKALRASSRAPRFSFTRIISIFIATAIIGFGIYRASIYLLDALLKILLFFGSYTDVIVHGIGFLTEEYDAVIVFYAAMICLTGFVMLWWMLKEQVAPSLWPLFIVAMAGGAFGFTTMTLTIPLFLIIISVLIRLSLRKHPSVSASVMIEK